MRSVPFSIWNPITPPVLNSPLRSGLLSPSREDSLFLWLSATVVWLSIANLGRQKQNRYWNLISARWMWSDIRMSLELR